MKSGEKIPNASWRTCAYGSRPAPCIKTAANAEMYYWLGTDMDISAGAVLTDSVVLEQKGEEICRLLLEAVLAQQPKSEAQGWGDYQSMPWQTGTTA